MKLTSRNGHGKAIAVLGAFSLLWGGVAASGDVLAKVQTKASAQPALKAMDEKSMIRRGSHAALPQFRIRKSMQKVFDFVNERSVLRLSKLETGCGDSSRAVQWIQMWMSRVDSTYQLEVQALFENLFVEQLPFFYKIFLDQSEDSEYFGVAGKYTSEILDRYDQLETFWELTDSEGGPADLTLDHTILMGAHGSILSDRTKLVPLLDLLFEMNPGFTISQLADSIQFLIEEAFPRKYDFPLFTANAIAFMGEDEEILQDLGITAKDAVVMGDGILEMFEALGYRENGGEYILAHEFGHQLQGALDLPLLEGETPEASRAVELMADAFSAYFLGHNRGGALSLAEIEDVTEVAFHTGDCSFSSEDHHGTPLQRQCAAEWASDLAKAEGSSVSNINDLLNEFNQALGKILALDSSTCSTTSAPSTTSAAPGASSWPARSLALAGILGFGFFLL